MEKYEKLQSKACKGMLFRDTCSSPAQIILQLIKVEKIDMTQNQLYQIHDKIGAHIQLLCNDNCQQFACSVINIENIIR